MASTYMPAGAGFRESLHIVARRLADTLEPRPRPRTRARDPEPLQGPWARMPFSNADTPGKEFPLGGIGNQDDA